MKRFLCLSACLVAACAPSNDAPAPIEMAESTQMVEDRFLEQLQADYPATLSPIADGIWVHTTSYTLPGQPPIPINGLVVVDGEDVTLINAAWGELATVALIETVRQETGKPVTKLIVTDHHTRRTQGVDAAEREGLQIYTHPDTPMLAALAGWPVPNTSVAALEAPKSRTRVGRIELTYPGPAYAQDNLVAYLPDESILYAGSAVRGAEAESLGNHQDADLNVWRESLNWVKATYPSTTLVVPGHGKGADLTLIDATIALIDAELSDG